ncbi:MAG TPA: hypothetical protein VGR72_05080 [Candidatus Acidoferrales bacterium]|nr:hypothetical protein [Candidatus Acidoferrales bacterium]
MRAWAIFTLLAIASVGSGLAEASIASFSIAISAARTPAKRGSPLEVRIVLTNTTGQSRLIYQDTGGEFDYTIHVSGQDNNEPPETRYFRAVKGKDSGKPTLVVEHSGGLRLVKAGGTLTDTIDLNQLYGLQPGKYTIQVERPDDDGKTVVKSNTITVTITP